VNISLTPQLEAMIRQKVESDLYDNASEVVREVLQLLEDRDRRERLRAMIAIGDEQLARGEYTTWITDSMRRLIQEADAEERQGLPIRNDILP
jgi:antitoxin ParD1/3/4